MNASSWPALFERHPQPMWILDPARAAIVAVNDAAVSHFGFPRPAFLGLTLPDLRARDGEPSQLELWLRDPNRAPMTEALPIGVVTLRTAWGETAVETTLNTVTFEGADRLLCLMDDVADRRRAAEAMRRSQERFVALTRAVNGLIWDYDLVTGEVWRGDGTQEIFGTPATGLAATLDAWLERIHPDDVDRVSAAFQEAIDSRSTTWGDEYRFVRADGSTVAVQDCAAILRDPAGRAVRMIGAAMDISGRRRAEAAQVDSERRLRALFDSALVGIAFGDFDGTIFQGNDAFLRITGYSREDFEARRINVRDITPPEQMAMTDRALEAATRGTIPPYEKEYIRKDGTRVPVLVNLGMFPDSREGFALVLDVTEKKRAERELVDHQNRLQALFDNAQDAIMLFNQFGYFIDANPAACQLLGYTRDEICRLHMYDMFPEDELARVVDIRQQVLATGRSQGEVRRRRKDGSIVEVEYRAVANITPGVHLTVLRDLSPRKQADDARQDAEVRLAAHQQRLQALFDNSLDAIVLFDDHGLFLDLNLAACELYGWAREELVGRPFRVVLSREDEAPTRADLERLKREGRRSGVLRMQRRDHSIVEVEARAVADIVPGVHMAVLRDLRERRESERVLRNLSGRLLRLQDEERRRLAREIHDSTAQGLAALSLGLGVIAKAAQRLGAREQQALADAQAQVEQSTQELRTISYLLHPPLLDEMGLASALRAYADGFSNRSGVRVTLQVPEQDTRLPGEAETALFRMVQECLTNIHRHSGSPTAHVRLLLDAESAVLEVSDQGKGLNVPAPGGSPRSELGVGIVGMQERVRQLGGRLEIESGRTGTTVRAVLPRVDP